MSSHETVWSAIDALAARRGLTASGLARKAGLDPTAFNPSKRTSGDGRPRWPSTESIGKVLIATGASIEEFVALVRGPSAAARTPRPRPVPLLGLAQAGAGGYFDDAGFPVGQGWDAVAFPLPDDENAYALKVTGESMLPLYREGDTILVSPAARIRKGDRVVVKTRDGEVMAKVLGRRTREAVELTSLNPEHGDRTIPLASIEWMARIVWASQ